MTHHNPKAPTQDTLDLIRERFYLDDTGALRVKERYLAGPKGWMEVDDLVEGAVCSNGYRSLGINGRLIRLHHIVHFLHTGEWPSSQLNHIDRDVSNNHPNNLEQVTGSQNQHNRGAYINNTSGTVNVSEWSCGSGSKYWKATLADKGKFISQAFFPYNDEGKAKAEAYSLTVKAHTAKQHMPAELRDRANELGLDEEVVFETIVPVKTLSPKGYNCNRYKASVTLANGTVVEGPDRTSKTLALTDASLMRGMPL